MKASRWSGKLIYTPYTDQGDIIPDFSHCGYGGGGVAFPQPAVSETVQPDPSSADDTPRIQLAIDRVSSRERGPDGFRGAVLLKRGTYRCSAPLRIKVGGVVLRGEGDGADGTILWAEFKRARPLIEVGGPTRPEADPATLVEIADAYVPVGSRTFSVKDASAFQVGQGVYVRRSGNAVWITEIGMDRIVPREQAPESTRQWKPFDLDFDRVITAIKGNQITIDAPISCAVAQTWGGGAVVAVREQGRIEHCGVEFIRAHSAFDPKKVGDHRGEKIPVDEEHANYLVNFGSVKNAWARHLTTLGFAHGPARMLEHAKWITVEDCKSLAPVSQITGGRRYPYSVDGQLVLVRRCYSEKARHAFVFGSGVPGPNVFLDCKSEQDYASSEPHHRWSVGGLYDNVEASIAIQDRGSMGSGHGWAGANYVVWNSRGELTCQKPPTAQNFAIGFVGKRHDGHLPRDPGWWESHGTPVKPQSLYLTQLAERKR